MLDAMDEKRRGGKEKEKRRKEKGERRKEKGERRKETMPKTIEQQREHSGGSRV